MRTGLLLTLALLTALVCGRALAEDAPAAAADQPSWKFDFVQGDIGVALDGKWLAVRARDAVMLLPAAGGTPVPLGLGKDDDISWNLGFTADSKWIVIPGQSRGVVVKDESKEKKQDVYVFSPDAPAKKRVLKVDLQVEKFGDSMPKEIRKRLKPPPNLKMLKGAASSFHPVGGSRMVVDRDDRGTQVWDFATGGRFAAPPALETSWECGFSADWSRCVRTVESGLEIRDARSNRVIQRVAAPQHAAKDVGATYPIFSPDGSRVLNLRGHRKAGEALDEDYFVECWSAADGKKLWETPVGAASYVSTFAGAGGYALVHADKTLRLLDLRDGTEVPHGLGKSAVTSAAPAADGKNLWVIVGTSVLKRVALPPLPER